MFLVFLFWFWFFKKNKTFYFILLNIKGKTGGKLLKASIIIQFWRDKTVHLIFLFFSLFFFSFLFFFSSISRPVHPDKIVVVDWA